MAENTVDMCSLYVILGTVQRHTVCNKATLLKYRVQEKYELNVRSCQEGVQQVSASSASEATSGIKCFRTRETHKAGSGKRVSCNNHWDIAPPNPCYKSSCNSNCCISCSGLELRFFRSKTHAKHGLGVETAASPLP